MGADAKDSRRAIFVISGTQGAGKTTVSSMLAQRFDHGVHIPADTLQKMILSGRVWPQPHQVDINSSETDEAARQLRLRLHNACLLARSFYDAGFTVVIDDIIIESRLHQLRDELHGLPLLFVMLSPSRDVVREREAQRGTQLWREWEWLTERVASMQPRIGLWLDTSGQTVDQTVDEIMRRAWLEAALPSPAVPA